MERMRGAWVVLALVLVLTAGVRWRLLDVPLERDEGEYAYAGRLILEGTPPYAEAYNAKLPGIYAAYAVVMAVFGESARGIRLGLTAINLVTVLLVFLLARRLFEGPAAAVAAAAAFAVLSIGQPVQGMFANAEHFVLPFVVGSLWLALTGARRERAWMVAVAGLLAGCGFLMKQHAVFLVAATAAWLAVERPGETAGLRPRIPRVVLFGAAAVVPWLLTCLVMLAAGVFDRFWFWTVQYAWAYTRRVPLSEATEALIGGAVPVFLGAPLLWVLAAAGLVLASRGRVRLWVLAAFSAAATAPGWLFRPHYFLLTLPAAALLVGALVQVVEIRVAARAGRAAGLAAAAGLVLLATGQSLWAQQRPLFAMTPAELSRYTYGVNPFPESARIAEIVREATAEDDRVLVFGSEPQILFLADRHSATGYIYTYPLMEIQPFARRMQEEMIREVETARPEVIVFVYVEYSWLRRPDSETLVFDWFGSYRRGFEPLAVVKIGPRGSRFLRGADVEGFDPRSSDYVAIFRRRP